MIPETSLPCSWRRIFEP